MAPCFQSDPGPGYYPKDHGPYATQQDCEDDCTLLGACCTPNGCEQRTRCNCKASEGNIFLGVNVQCAEGICGCNCDAEACGLGEGSTLTLTVNGLTDRTQSDNWGTFCPLPPASAINGVPVCFEYDAQQTGGFCYFRTRRSCFYNGWFNYYLANQQHWIYFCFTDGVIRLYISGEGFIGSLNAAGSCSGTITSNNVSFISGLYNTEEASLTIEFQQCTPPTERITETCCWNCTPIGQTPVNRPQSIDVTISNVVSAGGVVPQVALDYLAGTYTLTRYYDCAYRFAKSTGMFGGYGFYALTVELRPERRDISTGACVDGVKWVLWTSFVSPLTASSGYTSYHPGITGQGALHSLPSCCAAETFTARGQREYSSITADIEVHCD